ncbi:site-2 protease family protein [Streptomyces sp. WMMB 322]|uniref:site-2 protease family protein n=1 Tax=Streptomyces sp. WMMB 322 TaxID=1286821 RepID=UPI0006E1BFEF|nr:site-2 protease family protein [Streptomyces sp. WMMB 322]SCK54072.1 Zn-dependent protease (includes SpoIVFB) [Streptomyces sp. WMMB 322]
MAETENGGRPRWSGSGDSGTAGEGTAPLPDRPDASPYPDGPPADTSTPGGTEDGTRTKPQDTTDPGPGQEAGTAAAESPAPAPGPATSGEAAPADRSSPGPAAQAEPEPRPAPAPAPASGTAAGGGQAPDPPYDAAPDADSAQGRARTGVASPGPRALGPDKPRRARPFGGGILMGRPFGVPVYVAPSWFLVAALITWVFGGQLDRLLPHLGAVRYLIALFFAVAFYASVLVHELAHTIAALRFKLPVRRIQLQFFGGVSEIEKEAETPGREFVLAFVGPLLSLALAGVFYGGMQAVQPGTVPGVLLAGLMFSNLIVAAFNLLPGLPLDGGRMLRALVWKLSGRPMTGTVFAAWIGRALAIAVLIGLPLATHAGGFTQETIGGVDSIMDALLAAILAAIIWTGAGNSLRMARLREHLPDLRARKLTRRAVPVPTDTPLSEALRRANDAGARALVVVDGAGGPVSLVREAAIAGVPSHRRPWVAVSSLAQELREGMRVPAELAGEELLEYLRATPATEYLVVEETGEIYGVLSAGDVERAFVAAMAKPSA